MSGMGREDRGRSSYTTTPSGSSPFVVHIDGSFQGKGSLIVTGFEGRPSLCKNEYMGCCPAMMGDGTGLSIGGRN